MGALTAALMGLIQTIWNIIVLKIHGLFEYLWAVLRDWVRWGIDYLVELLAGYGIVSALDVSNAFDFMYGFLDNVAWFVPVYPVLSIISSTYAAVGVIRGLRWILRIIPFSPLG